MKGASRAERNQGSQDVRGHQAGRREQGEGGSDSTIADRPGIGDGQAPEVQGVPAAAQAVAGKTYLTLSEDGIAQALIEARGDIFVASQLLGMGVTALRVDRAIRVSARLQAVVAGIQDVKGTESYLEATALDFHRAIERRMSLYRIAGLDALHELASMPIDENSAQNQVKLAAAARLVGPAAESQEGGELAETLRELNQLYHESAPKIKIMRQTLIEITPHAERDVSPLPEQPEK